MVGRETDYPVQMPQHNDDAGQRPDTVKHGELLQRICHHKEDEVPYNSTGALVEQSGIVGSAMAKGENRLYSKAKSLNEALCTCGSV